MKKVLLLLVVLLSLTVPCFAVIKESCDPKEICLGSVRIGDKIDTVFRIYGQPDKTVRDPEPVRIGQAEHYFARHYYGDSVVIVTMQCEGYDPWVIRVDSTRNNGWRTPSGLTVGTPIEAIPASFRAKEGYNGYAVSNCYLIFHIKSGKIVDISIACDPC